MHNQKHIHTFTLSNNKDMKITTKLINSMLGQQLTQREMIEELNSVAKLNGLTTEYVRENYEEFVANVFKSMSSIVNETVERLKR